VTDPDPQRQLAGRVRRTAFFLLLGAGFLYNLNLRGISSGDNVPGGLLPFALLVDHRITFDRYDEWFRAKNGETPYFFQVVRGHAYSRYPIALPLLVAPAYLPALAALGAGGWTTEAIVSAALRLEKLAGSAVAALAVVAFFLLAVRLTGAVRPALLLSLVFAFATPTWSISSQALWQHGGSQLVVLLGLTAMHFHQRSGSSFAAAAAGTCAGLAAAIRPTGVLFVLALYGYWLTVRPRRIRSVGWFSVPVFLIGAALAIYNLWVLGDLRGGYAYPMNGNFWGGLAGILVSPSRGLLVFCPFLAFAVVGAVCWARSGRPDAAVYLPAFTFTTMYTLVLAFWPLWWGGDSYGPRLMAEVAAPAAVLLLPAWSWITSRPVALALFAASAVYAAGLQAVGAFWYPRGDWTNTPVKLADDPGRLWDWRDNQVWRCIQAGPELRPYAKLFEEWFGSRPGAGLRP
jgi:hypothetical protein